MNIGLSLRTKTLALVIVIVLLLSATVITISYGVYTRTMDEHYRNIASNIAKTAASQMDGDRMAWYAKTLQKDEAYDQMLEILYDIKDNNDVTFLYVQQVRPDGATYLMDADDVETACPLGQTDPLAPATYQYLDHLEDGVPPIITHSEYGWLCTAGEPIFDSSGTVVALACVDLSMDEIMADRQHFLGMLILSMVLAILAATVLFAVLTERGVVAPINELAAAASAFVEEKDRDKTEGESAITRLRIHTGDEIESLARAIQKMEIDINQYIQNLTLVTAEKERISTELHVATQIQASMLPCIFPPYPDRPEFDIFASMDPAKEVGGDFYDFFLIDADHLAVAVADVSGKGVPAALFMVITKTLLKNHMQSGCTPAQAFTEVNRQLCENNEAGMFVTAWLGVLEISTKILTFANAGHNPPLWGKAEEPFAYLRSRPGLVLGGMEGMQYKENTLQLGAGDVLYLYTDGVTEAANPQNEMFGEARLLDAVNANLNKAPRDLLLQVKEQVALFSLGVPQFDDITMLALKLR